MNSDRNSRAALDAAFAAKKGVCLVFGAALNVFACVESLLVRGVAPTNIVAVTEGEAAVDGSGFYRSARFTGLVDQPRGFE